MMPYSIRIVVTGGRIAPRLSAGTLSHIVGDIAPMPALCERLHRSFAPRRLIVGRASSDDAAGDISRYHREYGHPSGVRQISISCRTAT